MTQLYQISEQSEARKAPAALVALAPAGKVPQSNSAQTGAWLCSNQDCSAGTVVVTMQDQDGQLRAESSTMHCPRCSAVLTFSSYLTELVLVPAKQTAERSPSYGRFTR
jgi:hypothetical protein